MRGFFVPHLTVVILGAAVHCNAALREPYLGLGALHQPQVHDSRRCVMRLVCGDVSFDDFFVGRLPAIVAELCVEFVQLGT
jgi:hypothetical protein